MANLSGKFNKGYEAMTARVDVVVAGHICLDLIPAIGASPVQAENLLLPGRMVQVGPATMALGGAVANTGMALHRLGASTRLLAKVGDDLFGKTILESLRKHDAPLADGIVVDPKESTSYSIVLSPPGADRSFLHCSGANSSFCGADLELRAGMETRLLHFGYPPLMRRLLADGGLELAQAFARVQHSGALVSLDMTMPDVNASVVDVDWTDWLGRVLPSVDLFLPSFDEILLMLKPKRYQQMVEVANGTNLAAEADWSLLQEIADQLIEMGSPMVAIKLGDCGIYLQTSQHAAKRLADRAAWQAFDWQAWEGRRLWAACFDVEVVGTTGAGDCTIAGLLMALLRGLSPEAALRLSTAVGAWCVQSCDATSNIPAWSEVEESCQNRWPLCAPSYELNDWMLCPKTGVYSTSK